MTHPYLQDSEPPPNKSVLDQIQRRSGVVFPPDYRDFLLKCNGGVFRQEVVYVEDGGEDDDAKWCFVRELYGVSTERLGLTEMGLEFHVKTLRNRIPREFIPIGRDYGGDQICLGVLDPYIEMVWKWNHEGDEDEPLANMSFVSKSFKRFMECLRLAPDTEYEETDPIFQSIERGDLERLRFLLAETSSLDRRNAKGFTPLQFAAWIPQSNVIELLLDRGKNIDVKDASGKSALATAAERGSVDIVGSLIRSGADVDCRDNEGNTPLMHAARGAVPRVIKRLIDAGADVNATRYDGMSPLMLCFRNELNRKLLLQAGAKIRLGPAHHYYVPAQVPDEWSRNDVVK